MIDRQVPTGDEISRALFGLFKRALSCDQRVLRKTLFPGDPELGLSVTYVPSWEYDELKNFVKMIEDIIPLHKKSDKTRLRLIGYCHIMEADVPFTVIWNLLRIIAGQEPSPKFVVQDKGKEKVCEHPTQKISAIANLDLQLKKPIGVGDCLKRLWDSRVRNAFSHSQYELKGAYNGYMMLTGGLSPHSRKSVNHIRGGKGNPSFDDIRDLYQGALDLLNSFDAKYNEAKQNILNTTAS